MSAEAKKPIVLGLGRGYNGFYCPETRFHLIGVMRPTGVYPSDVLSEDVKRGLRGGSLIDVNKVLTEADILPGKNFVQHTSSGDVKKILAVKQEEQAKEESNEGTSPSLDERVGTMLSEADIDTGSSKVLLAFVEKTEGLTLEGLGLSSKPRVDDLRDALKLHFGYITEIPQKEEE